jgi:hypothetical protein
VPCDALYQTLPPAQIKKFQELRLHYARSFMPGIDVPWQKFFQTSNPRAVDARCRQQGVSSDWESDDAFRISTNRPAIMWNHHREQFVFFNQLLLHHPACLDEDIRDDMADLFGQSRLPRDVPYGDGTAIADEIITGLLKAATRWAVCFSW